MRRVLTALALVVGIVAPVTSASALPVSRRSGPAPGSIGVRIVDVPTTARNDPRARVYIVDHVGPGTAIRRRIEVSNATHSTAQLAVYAAAADVHGGTFAVAAGRTANELSGWTTVTPAAPVLAPGSRTLVFVTIAVPPDASRGERYGVVWAEAVTPAPAGGGVTFVNRVGIRIYLFVGPGGAPASDFRIDSLTAQRSPSGQPMVVASVRNIGGRSIDMSGRLRLSGGPGGLGAGPFPARLGTTLAPGEAEPVTVALDKQLPDGPWHARIDLTSGVLHRTAEATIRFPHNAGAVAPVPAERNPSKGSHIWPIAAGLLGLAIAFALFFPRRKRRRSAVREAAAGAAGS